ncbi:MAG: HlyC/CorC family transporter [Bacilli bacterium]|nr:HlyC/CorC family transporter [Bacilli bacterium]
MLTKIILLSILILINGILSASEIAYLSIDKYKLERKRNKKNKKILNMLNDESSFLSTIQIGITLAGFLASAFASETFTEAIMNYGFLIINKEFTENFLLVIITIILSYITLIFGELVPKKIGRSNPEKICYLTINIISIIKMLFYPFINFLSFSTETICKILKVKDRDNSLTEKDIKRMIVTGSKEGIVEEKEKEYILNIFEFNDKTANKIMIPKEKVISINITDTKKQLIDKIKKTKFTRFPVLDNEKPIGFINVKDFIYLQQNNKEIKLKDLIHPVLKFNKTEKIDDIFRIMQEKHETFSCIIHKNEFVGILTMEDAIEEIVGNIKDEYN